MTYFKILNIEKNAYWLQDGCGYTSSDEEAGRWSLEAVARFLEDDQQVIIPEQLSREQLIQYLVLGYSQS